MILYNEKDNIYMVNCSTLYTYCKSRIKKDYEIVSWSQNCDSKGKYQSLILKLYQRNITIFNINTTVIPTTVDTHSGLRIWIWRTAVKMSTSLSTEICSNTLYTTKNAPQRVAPSLISINTSNKFPYISRLMIWMHSVHLYVWSFFIPANFHLNIICLKTLCNEFLSNDWLIEHVILLYILISCKTKFISIY